MMKNIENNTDIFRELKGGEYSIIDSKISKLELFNECNSLVVNIIFEVDRGNRELVHFKLSNIIEFGFYYSEEFIFYNVEQFKLLSLNDSAYLSLDPDLDSLGPSDADQDFVRAKNITVHVEKFDELTQII